MAQPLPPLLVNQTQPDHTQPDQGQYNREQQRLVFQFRYFDELPYADIAHILGTSQGGLKANYHHAVAKIKKSMVGLNLDLHSES